jgi:hypothetical protein
MPQVNFTLNDSLNEHLRRQIAKSRRTLQVELTLAIEAHLGVEPVFDEATKSYIYRPTPEAVDELFES